MFQSTVSQINIQTVENPGRKFVPIDFRGKYKRLQLAEQQSEKGDLSYVHTFASARTRDGAYSPEVM